VHRLDRLREHIDVERGRGLEIGPLASPVVPRELGSIAYVDHLPTDELRAKYRGDPDVDEQQIVSTDYVWGSTTLSEAVGRAAPVDYVVASHVLEHVPDLVGWLDEVTAVLRPGGRVSLAMPDRRYTFDVRRRDTDISEIVEAYLLHLRRPSVRAIFDHFYRFVAVNSGAIWAGEPGHEDPAPDAITALAFATKAATTNVYLDTHCWVFSDSTFVDLVATLIGMDLVTLSFVSFHPTQAGESEFFVTLERPSIDLTRDDLKALCVRSVPAMPLGAPIRTASVALAAADRDHYILSGREVALLRAKRNAMARMRKVRRGLGRR
jgi:SAM-dependent methyltransferase